MRAVIFDGLDGPHQSTNLIRDVPMRLLQIFQLLGWVFLAGPPDIFDGVPSIEIEMAGHLDAFNVVAALVAAMGAIGIVGWVIDRVG